MLLGGGGDGSSAHSTSQWTRGGRVDINSTTKNGGEREIQKKKNRGDWAVVARNRRHKRKNKQTGEAKTGSRKSMRGGRGGKETFRPKGREGMGGGGEGNTAVKLPADRGRPGKKNDEQPHEGEGKNEREKKKLSKRAPGRKKSKRKVPGGVAPKGST